MGSLVSEFKQYSHSIIVSDAITMITIVERITTITLNGLTHGIAHQFDSLVHEYSIIEGRRTSIGHATATM